MQYNVFYRDKDGNIQFIISYKDQFGKWRQKSRQGYEKKSDAKKAADKMLDELKKNFELHLSAEYEGMTFKEFTAMFLEHNKLYKEHNTIQGYNCALKKFSLISTLALCKITSMHIQQCVDAMVKEGLSPATIKGYMIRVKTIFNNAIEPHKIITVNPFAGAKIPEDKRSNDKVQALTKTELDKLLSGLTDKKHYIVSLVASKCGLRIGEVLGLTWDDVDWLHGNIKVNKQWKFLKNGKNGFGPVKSKNSNRTVPAPKSVLTALKEYKASSPAPIDGRIIPYTSLTSTTTRLRRTYKKIGYDITLHDLRHTYASLLIADGVDFKTAAQLLGHGVEQTMNTYSHVTSDMIARAAKAINSIFD